MKIDVLIVTYNHQQYIRKCLDSVLRQGINNISKVFILDDGSTDNTIDIVNQYIKKYSSLFTLLRSEKKYNSLCSGTELSLIHRRIRFNYIKGLMCCTEKYVSLLEGDDYWCDGKIKEILKILKHHKQPSFIYHKYNILDKNVIKERYYSYLRSQKVTIIDEIKSYQVQNLSCLTINLNDFMKVSNQFKDSPGVDYGLVLLLLNKKDGFFLNKTLSVYRIHNDSTWNHLPDDFKIINSIYRRYQYKLLINNKKYDDAFKFAIDDHISQYLQKQNLNNTILNNDIGTGRLTNYNQTACDALIKFLKSNRFSTKIFNVFLNVNYKFYSKIKRKKQ